MFIDASNVKPMCEMSRQMFCSFGDSLYRCSFLVGY